MWIALGDEPKVRAGERQPERADGRRHQPRASFRHRLGAKVSEMLMEPRPPGQRKRIPRLQDRPKLSRPPALHQTHVPAMPGGQYFQDDISLAVATRPDDDSFFGPFHALILPENAGSKEPQVLSR
jgi:hypothetical protein